jgi:hypothetical protein
LQRLRANESKENVVEKIFNDTHPQFPPPQKRWRPNVVEANQMTTKAEDKTTTAQLFVSTTDSPAAEVRPSTSIADRPTLEFGPSMPR